MLNNTPLEKSEQTRIVESTKEKTPDTLDSEFEIPDPLSAGVINTSTKDGVRVFKDGSIELHAGECRILMDANTGQITILGNSLVFQGQTAAFHIKDGGFFIGYRALNPEWLAGPLSGFDSSEASDAIGELARSPLVLNLGGASNALSTDISSVANTMQLMVMMPGLLAPIPIPFSKLFKPVPLFKRSSKLKTMLTKVKDIIKGIIE